MDTRTVLTLTLSGDVSDYTPAVRTELKMTFAEVAGVLPEQVLVTIEAGSVVVGVEIESPAGAAPAVLARLQNASRTPAALTAILSSRVQGITIFVESIDSLTSEPLWSPPSPSLEAISRGDGDLASVRLGIIVGCSVGGVFILVCYYVQCRRRGTSFKGRQVAVGPSPGFELGKADGRRSRVAIAPDPSEGP